MGGTQKYSGLKKVRPLFCGLSDAEKRKDEEIIRNGLNYAKKVLTTEECDLLVLDEGPGPGGPETS